MIFKWSFIFTNACGKQNVKITGLHSLQNWYFYYVSIKLDSYTMPFITIVSDGMRHCLTQQWGRVFKTPFPGIDAVKGAIQESDSFWTRTTRTHTQLVCGNMISLVGKCKLFFMKKLALRRMSHAIFWFLSEQPKPTTKKKKVLTKIKIFKNWKIMTKMKVFHKNVEFGWKAIFSMKKVWMKKNWLKKFKFKLFTQSGNLSLA